MYGRVALLSFIAGAAIGTMSLLLSRSDVEVHSGSFATKGTEEMRSTAVEPARLTETDDVVFLEPPPPQDMQLAAHVLLDEVSDASKKPFEQALENVQTPASVTMTYDGHTFEEWKAKLLSELKPERRIEAVQAVHRFGMNGHAQESAETILRIANSYSLFSSAWLFDGSFEELAVGMWQEKGSYLSRPDAVLVRRSAAALIELAPLVPDELEAAAMQPLTKSVAPLIALRALAIHQPDRAARALIAILRNDARPIDHELAEDQLSEIQVSSELVPELIGLAREKQQFQHTVLRLLPIGGGFRRETVAFLYEIAKTRTHNKEVLRVLSRIGLLKALAEGGDLDAFGVTRQQAMPDELIPVLLGAFREDCPIDRCGYEAAAILGQYGERAASAIPTLEGIIESRPSHNHIHVKAAKALQGIKAAMPQDGPDSPSEVPLPRGNSTPQPASIPQTGIQG